MSDCVNCLCAGGDGGTVTKGGVMKNEDTEQTRGPREGARPDDARRVVRPGNLRHNGKEAASSRTKTYISSPPRLCCGDMSRELRAGFHCWQPDGVSSLGQKLQRAAAGVVGRSQQEGGRAGSM